MYSARRISDAPVLDRTDSEVAAAAFRFAPRRAARSHLDVFRTRIAPTAVSVALLATSGAFALNLKASESATAAVPAPVRVDESTSRDATRTLALEGEDAADAETPGSDAAPAEDAAATATFTTATWASAFGAVIEEQYAQSGLIVRAQATKESAELGKLDAGDKVSITDKVEGDYRQVSFEGKVGYVLASKLGAKPPVAGSAAYTGPTTYTGTRVLGLTPTAMIVYNAVMATWGSRINSVGGYRASSLSDHQFGRAIDFMLTPGSESAMGWEMARYLAANASVLKVDHIIFEQKIWTPYNPTWRPMADRGSITANHYDHVHVSVS